MSLSLVPARVFSSYAAVTPEYLADRGVRLLLSDLDFTLAPKSCPAPDEAVRAWIASMQRAGIEVMILSNNRSPVRVERFCKDLGIPDMLGANLNGCLALMVEPMGGAVTPWQKVLHALQCPFKALAWEK